MVHIYIGFAFRNLLYHIIIDHDCCDLCEKKCDCKQCVTLPLEKILELTDLGVATTDEVSDSDSDSNTISYIYQSASDTDDALLDLNLENTLSL
jgi:hypothetical protein